MSEQRLSNLAILSIERDFSASLELDFVVDKFAHKNRRIINFYNIIIHSTDSWWFFWKQDIYSNIIFVLRLLSCVIRFHAKINENSSKNAS